MPVMLQRQSFGESLQDFQPFPLILHLQYPAELWETLVLSDHSQGVTSEGFSCSVVPFMLWQRGRCFCHVAMCVHKEHPRAGGAGDTRTDRLVLGPVATSLQQEHGVTSSTFFSSSAHLVSRPPKVDSERNIRKNEAMDKDYNRQVIIIKKELLDNWIDNWVDRCG